MNRKILKNLAKVIGLSAYALLLVHCPLLRAAGCAREATAVAEGAEGAPLEAAILESEILGLERELNPGAEETRREMAREPRVNPAAPVALRRFREPGEPMDSIGPARGWEPEGPAMRGTRLRQEDGVRMDEMPTFYGKINPDSLTRYEARVREAQQHNRAIEGRQGAIDVIPDPDFVPSVPSSETAGGSGGASLGPASARQLPAAGRTIDIIEE